MSGRLGIEGQLIWVIGAGGGGIGTAMCREFTAAGAHVVAVDRDEGALAATVDACEGPGRLTLEVADALEPEELAAMAGRLRGASGPPTGLVNVVGGLARDRWGAIQDVPKETFDAVFDLNLRCAWNTSRLFARERVQSGGGGSIVQLSSIAALQAMPFGAVYAAAKAALLSLTRTMALEWGGDGIRVNALAAGSVRVPRSDAPEPESDAVVIPLGRRGQPSDLSGAALFLLSGLSQWMTGQVLVIDGGASVLPAYLDGDGIPVFVSDSSLRSRLVPPSEAD